MNELVLKAWQLEDQARLHNRTVGLQRLLPAGFCSTVPVPDGAVRVWSNPTAEIVPAWPHI